jgi:hypothetical protein
MFARSTTGIDPATLTESIVAWTALVVEVVRMALVAPMKAMERVTREHHREEGLVRLVVWGLCPEVFHRG